MLNSINPLTRYIIFGIVMAITVHRLPHQSVVYFHQCARVECAIVRTYCNPPWNVPCVHTKSWKQYVPSSHANYRNHGHSEGKTPNSMKLHLLSEWGHQLDLHKELCAHMQMPLPISSSDSLWAPDALLWKAFGCYPSKVNNLKKYKCNITETVWKNIQGMFHSYLYSTCEMHNKTNVEFGYSNLWNTRVSPIL